VTHPLHSVRTGSAADIPGIMHIMAAAFSDDFGEAWSQKQVMNSLSLPNHACLIYHNEISACPQAFLIWRWVADESEMLMLGVLPEWRRQDIASDLIDVWQHSAMIQGVSELFLEVRANNPAIALYNKKGFTHVGTRAHYYKSKNGQTFDAHTMRKYCG
jgi:[ribosomal protein S18]-alanine N-acetyltransferase